MDRVNPKNCENEKILYHGTSADTLKEIDTSGFNRSYAGKNGERHNEHLSLTIVIDSKTIKELKETKNNFQYKNHLESLSIYSPM